MPLEQRLDKVESDIPLSGRISVMEAKLENKATMTDIEKLKVWVLTAAITAIGSFLGLLVTLLVK